MKSKLKMLAVLAVAGSAIAAATATAGATEPAPKPSPTTTSTVYVTHGLPLDTSGTVVDVYVNDKLTLDDFKFGETKGPVQLPQGTYDVEVRTPDGVKTLIQKDIAVPGTGSFSIVASFVDAAGTPGLNVFANDVSKTRRWDGRLALHHAAAAPAVDVELGLWPWSRRYDVFKFTAAAGASNGAQAAVVLPSWLRYTVDVNAAGTDTTVLSLDKVKVPRRTLTNAYVVGSLSGDTLQVITSSIPLR